MPIRIGVTREVVPGEHRIPVVPEVARKYIALGAQVDTQTGADRPAHYGDEALADVQYAASTAEVCRSTDVVPVGQPTGVEARQALVELITHVKALEA